MLKIDFVDFYKELNKEDNIFINNLRKICEVEISTDPDLIFYGNYGFEHLKYNCYKVFYSSENVRPDYRYCDFSITFDFINDGRNFRLPLYFIHLKDFLEVSIERKYLYKPKNRFCNFIYSNDKAKERIEFFNLLSSYKRIDSLGMVLNNMKNEKAGERNYTSKLEFLSDYKFTIAFENESYPGYTTEKIIHPLLVGSIPIYWGNPKINLDFSSNSIINVHDFGSFYDVIERINVIDNDEKIYSTYFQNTDSLRSLLEIKEKELCSFFEILLSSLEKSSPIAQSLKGRFDSLSVKFNFQVKRFKYRLNKFGK